MFQRLKTWFKNLFSSQREEGEIHIPQENLDRIREETNEQARAIALGLRNIDQRMPIVEPLARALEHNHFLGEQLIRQAETRRYSSDPYRDLPGLRPDDLWRNHEAGLRIIHGLAVPEIEPYIDQNARIDSIYLEINRRIRECINPILNLSVINLSLANSKNIARLFTSIPLHVTTLVLNATCLSQLNYEDFNRMIQSIPKHVETIDLRDNELANVSDQLRYQIIDVLASSGKTILIEEPFQEIKKEYLRQQRQAFLLGTRPINAGSPLFHYFGRSNNSENQPTQHPLSENELLGEILQFHP